MQATLATRTEARAAGPNRSETDRPSVWQSPPFCLRNNREDMSDEYSETDTGCLSPRNEIAMREPGQKRQLKSIVNGGAWPGDKPRPWTDVAQFTAFCVQGDTLI